MENSDWFAAPRSGVFEPIDGVLEPPSVEVSMLEASLGVVFSPKICAELRSRPVIASDMVRKDFSTLFEPFSETGLSATIVELVACLVVLGSSESYSSLVTVGGDMLFAGSLITRMLAADIGFFSGLGSREPLKKKALARLLDGECILELSTDSPLVTPLRCRWIFRSELYSSSFVTVLNGLPVPRSTLIAFMCIDCGLGEPPNGDT